MGVMGVMGAYEYNQLLTGAHEAQFHGCPWEPGASPGKVPGEGSDREVRSWQGRQAQRVLPRPPRIDRGRLFLGVTYEVIFGCPFPLFGSFGREMRKKRAYRAVLNVLLDFGLSFWVKKKRRQNVSCRSNGG